jgi:membrane-associated phospholipid phosphatase
MLADHWVYTHAYRENLYDLDWARFLREMGWLPTWLVAALAMWLQQRASDGSRATKRAAYLAVAPTAAGIVCELLKLLFRRERPDVAAGYYSFRAWSDHPFSTAGLAMPSSHAMVAFAAATALTRLFPRAKWVWFALAAACGVTRIMAHAHFFSDVMLGALFGWCVAWGIWLLPWRAELAGERLPQDSA